MPQLGMKKWEKVVDEFYEKYKGLYKWQQANYKLVLEQGFLKTFSGREYIFNKYRNKDGSQGYSWPQVCNYVVQGSATADVMPLCMMVIYRRLIERGYMDKGVKLLNQVHDSIIMDSPDYLVEEVASLGLEVFRSIPQLVKGYWGYDWVVPMNGEGKCGYNWSDMEKLKL